ncbi:hypothetical protein [Catenuloplanes japonicus]|uniref:hypothetical protein n=1 Tax=Catenuloplanes japonicus TaxID=33876 RepID=UPI0005246653|nr:hypothetical protein [Catenuloplanes japonicus]
MSYYKRHCTRTAIAMWAVAATVLTVASASTALLIALSAIVIISVAAVGSWFLLHRAVPQRARHVVPIGARRQA